MVRHEWGRGADVGDPATHMIRLLGRPCDTCVTFPDDRARLGEPRRTAFIQEALDRDTYIVCHETLGTGSAAICRGFYNLHRTDVLSLRLLVKFDMVVEVWLPASDD